MVGDEAVGDRAALAARPCRQRGDPALPSTLGAARQPVGQHAVLSREDDRDRLRQRVVQDHRDRVALVDAQHRPGVLEVVEAARVAPHEDRVAVGEADVAGLGGQVEDRVVARHRCRACRRCRPSAGGPAAGGDLGRSWRRPARQPVRRRRRGLDAGHRPTPRSRGCARCSCFRSPSRSGSSGRPRCRSGRRGSRWRPAEAAGGEVGRPLVGAVVEQVGVGPAPSAVRRRREDDVEALAGADVDRLGLVRRVGARRAPASAWRRGRRPASGARPASSPARGSRGWRSAAAPAPRRCRSPATRAAGTAARGGRQARSGRRWRPSPG